MTCPLHPTAVSCLDEPPAAPGERLPRSDSWNSGAFADVGESTSLALALLTSHLLAAAPCRPAQWLAPRAEGDWFGIPWSGHHVPRACTPCRLEATFPGQQTPWQTHRWTFDADGQLTRIEKRIGTSVSVTSCARVAHDQVECRGAGAPFSLTLQQGRVQRTLNAGWDTRYQRDRAGRVNRIVKRVEESVPKTSLRDADAEEPWWTGSPSGSSAAGVRVTRSFLFSITTVEYDAAGHLVSETEQRAEGETVRTRHYDALGRYVGTMKRAPGQAEATWQERLTWESPSRVVQDDGTSANVLLFDEQGRLGAIEEHRKPGVMGGGGDARFVYGCDAAQTAK